MSSDQNVVNLSALPTKFFFINMKVIGAYIFPMFLSQPNLPQVNSNQLA